jgi:hypothetical protein
MRYQKATAKNSTSTAETQTVGWIGGHAHTKQLETKIGDLGLLFVELAGYPQKNPTSLETCQVFQTENP